MQLLLIRQGSLAPPNEKYVLRFAMAGNPFGYTNKVMSVRWGGIELTNLIFPWYSTNRPTNMCWRYHSLVVTSTAAGTRLEFASLTGVMNGAQGITAYYGPALDDVSVLPFVPPRLEPPLLGGGTATVAWTSFPGLSYQLLSSTKLANWIPASEWSTASSNTLSATTPFDASRKVFFR